ncbi:rubrerythrin family protein [Myxococcota bacterium]|nr:rubrerythrin family protein [Myxococcota bacterium]
MSLKGTQTEKNLLKAFAGESQARNRYDYFAKQAKKEGLVSISELFTETALNEKEHAKRFFKFLEDGAPLEVTAMFPAGKIGTTLENLKAAADGEHEEWGDLYPEFARVAEAEGFKDIAAAFRLTALIEKAHEARYRKLHHNLENGKVFEKDEMVVWKCINCGYLHEGKKAPDLCPACLHPRDYFEIQTERY